MIFNIVILGRNLLNGWCRMRMRPARLVSYAFLYTTDTRTNTDRSSEEIIEESVSAN